MVMNLAERHCTLSSWSISSCKWGSHTTALYSKVDRRSAKDAVFLHDLEQCLSLRFKNPSVEFAFLVMFLMCGLNLRSSKRITPRYGFTSTCLRI